MYNQLTPKTSIWNQIKNAAASFIGGALIALLLAFPIKWLWNWLMPGLFGLPIISALEAWGISFLAKLIFPTVVTLSNKEKQKNQNP